jgi:hypothetical protein
VLVIIGRFKKFILLLVSIAVAAPFMGPLVSRASAAEIGRHLVTGGFVDISIVGEVVEGDTEALRMEISKADSDGHVVHVVELNSIGGSLYEGTSIARVIRSKSLSTSVPAGATCASVCFLAFAAGTARSIGVQARVGVHVASDEFGKETSSTSEATAAMARIAGILGVPPLIINKMVTTPATQMFWLDGPNLASMGASLINADN